MNQNATLTKGAFITFEGIDGCGKTTQAKALAQALSACGLDVVAIREPGGTPVGEKIRTLLLDRQNADIVDECELLLYEASRAQLVRQVIQPALERGAVVVCDRFYDSTYAYQCGARGLDRDLVTRANRLGSCGLAPDVTIVLDVDPELGHRRAMLGRGGQEDRIEAEGLTFQRAVRQGYMDLAQQEPHRVRVVDGSGEPAGVTAAIRAVVADAFPQLAAYLATGEDD